MVGLDKIVSLGAEASVCGGTEVRGVTVNYIISNTIRIMPEG